jgi:hypothetical protein
LSISHAEILTFNQEGDKAAIGADRWGRARQGDLHIQGRGTDALDLQFPRERHREDEQ